jgi:hypothetical protein
VRLRLVLHVPRGADFDLIDDAIHSLLAVLVSLDADASLVIVREES